MHHSVTIQEVVKRYGDFLAVDHANLEIKAGEFFTLLGPSGCGKTTLLRMIAGFNTIDEGNISFGQQRINDIEAYRRDTAMVFQNYAIFPHLTVYDNVAYGLKARKRDKVEIPGLVEKALDLMQIRHLASRKPAEMSGGQQQRIALARAIVVEPDVLLMDEPLSNLDAKLRVQMRWEIKKLQMRLGITTIYVTHDQEEALAISDRIAVMKDGHIMQVGAPKEIYTKPQNPFVAGFIGISNFLSCTVESGELQRPDGSVPATLKVAGTYHMELSLCRPFAGKALLSVRPEYCLFGQSEGLPGTISLVTFLGDFIEYEVVLDTGDTMQVNEYTKVTSELRSVRDQVCVSFLKDAVSLYEADTGENLI